MKYQLFTEKNTQKAENNLIEERESESLTSKQEIYRNYLKSVTWKHIREEALKYYNYTCQNCGKAGKDVHHDRYPSEWGQETIKDLRVLCRICHDKEHSPDKISKEEDDEFSSLERSFLPQYKRRRIHVRVISSSLTKKQKKILSEEYPNTDLHELFLSDTSKGNKARKRAIEILKMDEFYGLYDYRPFHTPDDEFEMKKKKFEEIRRKADELRRTQRESSSS